MALLYGLAGSLLTVLLAMSATAEAAPRDRDNNPPGPVGGRGTNWENPPGWKGGPGASPDRRWYRHGGKRYAFCCADCQPEFTKNPAKFAKN